MTYAAGPGERASSSYAGAPSSGYGMGSYSNDGGAGADDPVDYSSMIPDPALRQSFSQNVEEVSLASRAPFPAQLQPQC